MDWGGPEFVIAIIAISTFGWLASTWIRVRHGYPVENEWCGMSEHPDSGRKIELLNGENERLKGQIGRLEERLRVLERIATEPSRRLAEDIDKLGDR
ncbi:MAG TPA: hypothetical protein VMN38_04755 [Sphingomicrobium sp.]|nr:hypothetical protein [Sphingomicrobium sp.]